MVSRFFLENAQNNAELLPRSVGFAMKRELIWLHAASDALIGVACFLIPVALIWFLRRRRRPLAFSWALILFSIFVPLLGLSHLLDVVAIWQPIYYLQGYASAIAAIVGIVTAILILPLVPKLLAMRTSEELAEANQRLREEIASRELAEEDLRRTLEELKAAVHELEQFAYITSHDLQAPLRTISGFSQLLIHRYRTKFDGDGLEFLDYIDKGTRQMQTLIQDLLALSRVGRTDPSAFERRPLAESVTKAVQGLQEQINRSGAEIVFGTLPEITANHGLIQQLLHNLIGNAIKFQKPAVRPRVQIAIERIGENWELVIADNGIGIPADQLDSIFAIFRRLHPPELYEGTGIGLAICKKIVSYHGGEIWATSDEQGAQFHIRLPVSPVSQRRASSSSVVASARPILALV